MEEKITVYDRMSAELAEKIAAALWHKPDWRDTPMNFARSYEEKSDCFNVIAEAGDTVIGRIQCLLSMNVLGLWYYGDMFVAPEYRRRHIAEKMLNTALDEMRGRGCQTVRTYVERDNLPSLGLQRKFGFKEVPYERFDELWNEGELMFEKDPNK